ncbi:uncharacterized protein LOC113236703 [Hyposmocoma kahamanoa]|uniref:uncharacterized protein LOC113236703 n=1 Tax=Hyposmocoma kahamanoa TaxID=1477025 RepID=UPI000E6D70DA|nr:uncharacterized protein LOC113236703 [Hyposmocoma kahamanoa]
MEELETIKWEIVDLAEVRRKGEDLTILSCGHMLYHKGHDDSSCGGVGFLIHNRLYTSVKCVKIKLNDRYALKIIQVYAPTSDHGDDEMEVFCEHIEKAYKESPCWEILMLKLVHIDNRNTQWDNMLVDGETLGNSF